jgi:hypothetical protein
MASPTVALSFKSTVLDRLRLSVIYTTFAAFCVLFFWICAWFVAMWLGTD